MFNNDSELNELMNNPANDPAMELNIMLNFPELLDVTKKGRESSSTDDEKLQENRDQLL